MKGPGMGKYVSKLVVEGRMTHSTVVSRKGEGRCINVLVFADEKGTGEPVGEWDMPFLPAYDQMATLAAHQTAEQLKREGGKS